jgi:hypothetical protein
VTYRDRRRRRLDGCRWAGLAILLLAYLAPVIAIDPEMWFLAEEFDSAAPLPGAGDPGEGVEGEAEDGVEFGPMIGTMLETHGHRFVWGLLDSLIHGAWWAGPWTSVYAPSLLLLPWLLATLSRCWQGFGRRAVHLVMGATTVALAAGFLLAAWESAPGRTRAGLGLPIPHLLSFAGVAAGAVIALLPPRRRLRHDAMPRAAAAALVCAVAFASRVAFAMMAHGPGIASDASGLPRAGLWVPPALLLFALPSYLPRVRRRDRLGAPTLAAPATRNAAP